MPDDRYDFGQGTGELAGALAKAQQGFGTVTRSRTVTVQTKSGGSYSFKYAPLDTILEAVRGPLAKEGLALVQILDEGYLVTTLMHSSGGVIGGQIALPSGTDIQGLGSAITYLRRYAIQALLGIAAEEDDDGNRAAGNRIASEPMADQPATLRPEGRESEAFLGILTKSGVIRKGGADGYQLERRETPDGPTFGFRLELDTPDESGGHKAIPQVLVPPKVAVPLLLTLEGNDPMTLEKASVRLKGQLYQVSQPGRRSFYRLLVSEWKDDERSIPPDEPALPEPPDDLPLPFETPA